MASHQCEVDHRDYTQCDKYFEKEYIYGASMASPPWNPYTGNQDRGHTQADCLAVDEALQREHDESEVYIAEDVDHLPPQQNWVSLKRLNEPATLGQTVPVLALPNSHCYEFATSGGDWEGERALTSTYSSAGDSYSCTDWSETTSWKSHYNPHNQPTQYLSVPEAQANNLGSTTSMSNLVEEDQYSESQCDQYSDFYTSLPASNYISAANDNTFKSDTPMERNAPVSAKRKRGDLEKASVKRVKVESEPQYSSNSSEMRRRRVDLGKGPKLRNKKKERLACQQCHKSFDNASDLRKHVQVKHDRPFQCTFNFASCEQRFGSKNEWKRHVMSQHMNLANWECSFPLCKQRNAKFNRKDLFGQHLKRMHVPLSMKITNKMSDEEKMRIQQKNQETRDDFLQNTIPEIQQQCFVSLREPPSKSQCEICSDKFSGPGSWEQKMEHVGKHYENDGELALARHRRPDTDLINWALRHKLVEPVSEKDSTANSTEGKYEYRFSKTSPSSSSKSSTEKQVQWTANNHEIPEAEFDGVPEGIFEREPDCYDTDLLLSGPDHF